MRMYDNPTMKAFMHAGGELYVAIEKRPIALVDELFRMGHRHFSEKYVSGAGYQHLLLKNEPDTQLHLYGHLQRNKAMRAVQSFNCIESVDSEGLALRLRHCIDTAESSRITEVMVQLNQGKEPQKTGVWPEHAQQLIDTCRDLNLPLCGLMTIPPLGEDPEPYFRALRALADHNRLEHCQMGMSDDWEAAVRFGATRIRLGRAVFQ